MGAQKGKDLLLKVEDGAGFVTVAGLRARRLAFNAQSVDVTDSESAGRWRELLEGAGVRRAGLTGSGLFKDAASDALVRAAFFAGSILTYQVVIPDFGTVTAPVDFSSARPGEAVTPLDQFLGTGDGEAASFQLVKGYGDGAAVERRPVVKPVAGSVRVAIDGVEVTEGFSVDLTTGIVTFAVGHAPAEGTEIRAGFDYDVPVRFDTDRIEIDLEAFRAGRIPSIPLIEVIP
jgi:TP901-1 family phage major tail protein